MMKDIANMTMEEIKDATIDLMRTYYERLLLDFGENVANSIIDNAEYPSIGLNLDITDQAIITAQALARGKLKYLDDTMDWEGVKEMLTGDISQSVEMGLNKRGKTIDIKLEENEDGGGTVKLETKDLEDGQGD